MIHAESRCARPAHLLPLLRVLALCMVVAFSGARASAQTAPAGNAHPKVESLSDEAKAVNPFGEAQATKLDQAQKSVFSKAVNLEPMRSLAVFHGGRIKVMDTLGREMVEGILGRRDYQDLSIDAQGKVSRFKYDPLFTALDLMIDPGYYVDRPLVHVQFLPLREAFLKKMYENAEEREWWKRVGRLKPAKIVQTLDAVEQEHAFEPAYAKDIQNVRASLGLYQFAWRNLVLVASDSPDKPWTHLSELPADHPASKAARELGDAWRTGDAPRANAAIATLAETLPRINPAMYPTTKRSLEATYNRVNAFEWGAWLYLLAFLSLLLAFGTSRRWLVVAGLSLLAIAIGMHAFGFVSRCIIAERFAIQNQFESMTGVSLFAALVGSGIMIARRQWLFGAAAAGVGFMVLLTATQTGIPGVSVEREAAILNTSILLKYHVTTVLVSYGLIALGFVIALFYLGTHYATRQRLASAGVVTSSSDPTDDTPVALAATALNIDAAKAGALATHRVLSDLDKAHTIVLQLAFWTLGVGILLGAWWADHSWGRWWAFDPKELWALVTWIVYLVVVHVRFMQLKNRALTIAWLSVLGFIVMLWTYFGVNLLLPGLHAYA